MKILTHGNFSSAKKFKCWRCGCIFEADSGEYRIKETYHVVVKCPECGHRLRTKYDVYTGMYEQVWDKENI
jgi:RNase P subunit RPR2